MVMPSWAPDSMNDVRRVTDRSAFGSGVTGFGAGGQARSVDRHEGEFLGDEIASQRGDREDDQNAHQDSENGQHGRSSSP